MTESTPSAPRMPRTRLAKLRVAAGYPTVVAAARAVGISRIHCLNIEQGRATCSQRVREKMAELYGVPVSEIADCMNAERAELLERQLDHHRSIGERTNR